MLTKKKILVFLVLGFIFGAACALLGLSCAAAASEVVAPTVDMLGFESPVARVGVWSTVFSLVVVVVGQLLKSPIFGEFMKAVRPRRRILVTVGLSAIVAAAGAWLTGVSLEEGVAMFFSTMGSAVLVHNGLISSILGLKTGAKKVIEDPPSA